MTFHPLAELKRLDQNRSNIPGEHWLTLGAGIALWVATRKHPSGAVRLLAGIAGGLLVARAASQSTSIKVTAAPRVGRSASCIR